MNELPRSHPTHVFGAALKYFVLWFRFKPALKTNLKNKANVHAPSSMFTHKIKLKTLHLDVDRFTEVKWVVLMRTAPSLGLPR